MNIPSFVVKKHFLGNDLTTKVFYLEMFVVGQDKIIKKHTTKIKYFCDFVIASFKSLIFPHKKGHFRDLTKRKGLECGSRIARPHYGG